MALSQAEYRFGRVEGTESTHGWLAGADREVIRLPGAAGRFLLRTRLQETAGANENNVAPQLQHQRNGGGYGNTDGSSAVARVIASSVFTNTQHCTKRLNGTGTFESTAQGCTHDGSAGGGAMDIVANGNTEVLAEVQIVNTDTVVGDLIEFRWIRTNGTPFSDYAVTPAVRVAVEILAAQSRNTSLHFSQSVGVNKIRNTLVAVEAIGMSDADLADDTLSVVMHVWGTTVVGSTDPADYTEHLYGPDTWVGGPPSAKTGVKAPPNFAFAQDIPEGVRRVLATFQPSRDVTFGVQATLVE